MRSVGSHVYNSHAEPSEDGPVWRHIKRGTLYREIGAAFLQCSEAPADRVALVIYRGDDGVMWARPHDEFYDGRFERVTDARPCPRAEHDVIAARVAALEQELLHLRAALATAEQERDAARAIIQHALGA